jgi:hypothetical protein
MQHNASSHSREWRRRHARHVKIDRLRHTKHQIPPEAIFVQAAELDDPANATVKREDPLSVSASRAHAGLEEFLRPEGAFERPGAHAVLSSPRTCTPMARSSKRFGRSTASTRATMGQPRR